MKTNLSIFGAAVVVRLLMWWLLPEPHLPYNAVFAYLNGAELLLHGEGFSDVTFPFYTPPLYSMCIALVAFVFGGDGIVGIKAIQVLVDSLTAVTIFVIFRDLFDRAIGYLSATIWALYPFAVYPTLYIGTETLFTFFVALWVLLITRAMREGKWQLYCGAGVVLALATLTRGTTQFLPLLLPFVLLAFRKPGEHWLSYYLMTLACFILVILPWGVRNYLVLHEIIPVGANNTVVLWGSSEPLWTIDTRSREYPLLLEAAKSKGIVPELPVNSLVERDRLNVRLAMENYRERLARDPISIVPFMVKKFLRLWYSTESGSNHSMSLAINSFIYIPASVGVVVAWRRKRAITVALCGLVGYFAFLHWITLPLFRYMIPAMPYIIPFSAIGLLSIVKHSWPAMYARMHALTHAERAG